MENIKIVKDEAELIMRSSKETRLGEYIYKT
jgi:hypothetical protein